MTQDELNHLEEFCSFSSRVQARLPEDDKTIMFTRPSKVSFYARLLSESTLSYSPHPYGNFGLLQHLPHLTSHQCMAEYGGYPSNVMRWKKKFFFISGDNWEFAHGLSRKLGIPRVPRSWSTSGQIVHFQYLFFIHRLPALFILTSNFLLTRRCNVFPSLTKSEQERFDLISSALQKGEFYAVKKILRSKAFFRSFTLALKKMMSSKGDNAEEKNIGNTPHVAANEGESRHSRDDHSEKRNLGQSRSILGFEAFSIKNPAMAKTSLRHRAAHRQEDGNFYCLLQAVVLGSSLTDQAREMRDKAMIQQVIALSMAKDLPKIWKAGWLSSRRPSSNVLSLSWQG
ncbi:hypothetical protein Acr_23g0000620 [Actinidia rufa]|uniref:Uncharacterized protein n=1 Tax=Actinidia rufa TaxID=165716 RepID=A0A7J0GLH6_9ERIC|nr:hypothetical protein Acr_23g0000620 [Actinidia rufa]